MSVPVKCCFETELAKIVQRCDATRDYQTAVRALELLERQHAQQIRFDRQALYYWTLQCWIVFAIGLVAWRAHL